MSSDQLGSIRGLGGPAGVSMMSPKVDWRL